MKAISAKHKSFGSRVRDIRNDRGLTQESLAAKLDADRSYIAYIERGERNPSLSMIVKIARQLKVEVKDLFKGV